MTRFTQSVLFTLSLLVLAACNQLTSPRPADTPNPATPQLDIQATCVTNSSTVTCSYASTGSEQTFVVPSGVTSITVVARGASGGTGSGSGTGGRGAEVSADLSVTSGQTLYLNVGGAPTGNNTSNCYTDTACIGGFNGGGSSRFGGGGGGASDVRTVSRTASSGSLESRLLVAAGGGGGGESFYCSGSTRNGGAGGDAGSAGGRGEACEGTNGGTGGGAGTQSAGGAGGSPRGASGSLGQGGNGASNTGGAGGGGLYGGGGGGDVVLIASGFDLTAAGGGGGGSSLDPDGGPTPTLDSTRTPQITVSYTVPDTTGPSVTVNQADTQADPTTSSPIFFTVTFSETINETTLAFDDFSVSGTADATITDTAEITRGSVYRLSLTPSTFGTIIVSLPADKVTDLAGNPNSTSTSTDNTVTYVLPDTTPPTISLTTPADGATYKLKQQVNAAYSCSDEGSGVASCVGTVPDGSAIDTFSLGQKTFTVKATDNAGNPSEKTVSYRVIYNFKGFFYPVKNAPALNSYKAGLPVPFSFTLGGNYGKNVLSGVKSVAISCQTLQPLGSSSRESATLATQAGSSNLSAQSSTTIYLYLWQTQRAWKGSCREFTLTLNDATEHKANFKFN